MDSPSGFFAKIDDELSPRPTAPDNCFGAQGDTPPSWTTPGTWVQRMFLIDDKLSPVYSGSPGKHIPATAIDIGKTHEQFNRQ